MTDLTPHRGPVAQPHLEDDTKAPSLRARPMFPVAGEEPPIRWMLRIVASLRDSVSEKPPVHAPISELVDVERSWTCLDMDAYADGSTWTCIPAAVVSRNRIIP
jgi:hypothetical protein